MTYQPEPRYFNVNKMPILGKSVSLMNTVMDCNDQITIGDYVSFGHDCMLLTGKHDMYARMEERQVKPMREPIVIGNGVWIASGVIICAGVTIGDHAVIGAGSVVVGDVPPEEFWAGVPAEYKHKV